jgi:hypothetical protein
MGQMSVLEDKLKCQKNRTKYFWIETFIQFSSKNIFLIRFPCLNGTYTIQGHDLSKLTSHPIKI